MRLVAEMVQIMTSRLPVANTVGHTEVPEGTSAKESSLPNEMSLTANIWIGRIAESPVADSALVTFQIRKVELASAVIARSCAPWARSKNSTSSPATRVSSRSTR